MNTKVSNINHVMMSTSEAVSWTIHLVNVRSFESIRTLLLLYTKKSDMTKVYNVTRKFIVT